MSKSKTAKKPASKRIDFSPMPISDQQALMKLREIKAELEHSGKMRKVEADKRAVLAKYGPAFDIDNLQNLDGEVFKSFLYIENNNHWTGLNRKGGRACDNLPKLRKNLRLFLDESRPIALRVDEAVLHIPGMGKALSTAILMVAHPDRYGVWMQRPTKNVTLSGG
jgi:hypothetical protein